MSRALDVARDFMIVTTQWNDEIYSRIDQPRMVTRKEGVEMIITNLFGSNLGQLKPYEE